MKRVTARWQNLSGFAAEVTRELQQLAPVMPEVRVSALGTEAVVDGCLAAGSNLAWAQLTTAVPTGNSGAQQPGGPDTLADRSVRALRRFSQFVFPLVVVALGVLVGILVLGMFMPLIRIITGLAE